LRFDIDTRPIAKNALAATGSEAVSHIEPGRSSDQPPHAITTDPAQTNWAIDWFAPDPFAAFLNCSPLIERSAETAAISQSTNTILQMTIVESAPSSTGIANYVRSGSTPLAPPDPSLEFVTPQMMVHYFQPSSGTNEPSISVPIVFVPPQPPARPPGKATYQIAPPEEKR